MRPIHFERGFTKHAPGSVLASFGDTRVLCTATYTDGVPGFLQGKGRGWMTAEYSMLPSGSAENGERKESGPHVGLIGGFARCWSPRQSA